MAGMADCSMIMPSFLVAAVAPPVHAQCVQASLAIMQQQLAPSMRPCCSRVSFAASQQPSCQDLQELIIHSQLLLLLLCQLSQLLHLALQHDPLAVQLPDL